MPRGNDASTLRAEDAAVPCLAMRQFSAAEFLAAKYPPDPAWQVWKERGTEALSRGELVTAARWVDAPVVRGGVRQALIEQARKECYHEAAYLALGPIEGHGMDMFCEALCTWPEDSPQQQLAAQEPLVLEIMKRLPNPAPRIAYVPPDGGEPTVHDMPNRAAAIACANRAAAQLKAGQPSEALLSAEYAIELDPSYVKGHFRKMTALRQLGRRSEAAELQDQIEMYKEELDRKPAEEIALLSVGWIDLMQAGMVFGRTKFQASIEYIKQHISPRGERAQCPLQMRLMLVPVLLGQGLVQACAFPVASSGIQYMQNIQCLRFSIVDNHNHAALAHLFIEKPNRQRSKRAASKLALQHAPRLLLSTMKQLEEESGYKVGEVMLGLGFHDHTDLMSASLREAGRGDITISHEPWPGSPEDEAMADVEFSVVKRLELSAMFS